MTPVGPLVKQILAAALVAAMSISSTAIAETSKLPKVCLTAFVPNGSQTRFLAQLEEFAKDRAFSSDIAPMAPDGSLYRAYLWSQDIEIIAANPFSTCTFEIGMYEFKSPVPAERFEGVASELAQSIRNVENVEIVVRECSAGSTPARSCQ